MPTYRMTRIDYRRIAGIIAASWHIDSGDGVRWYIANHLADFLGEDNDRFEREVFLEHCDYDKQDGDHKPERKE